MNGEKRSGICKGIRFRTSPLCARGSFQSVTIRKAAVTKRNDFLHEKGYTDIKSAFLTKCRTIICIFLSNRPHTAGFCMDIFVLWRYNEKNGYRVKNRKPARKREKIFAGSVRNLS